MFHEKEKFNNQCKHCGLVVFREKEVCANRIERLEDAVACIRQLAERVSELEDKAIKREY